MKLDLASSTLRRARAAVMRRRLVRLAERLTPPSFPQIRLAEFCRTARAPGFARTRRSAS